MTYEGFDISGRVVLVTGGTSGLGQAMALGMARVGARVFVGSRDAERVKGMREALSALGQGNDALTLDVANPDSIKAAFQEVVKRAGRIDILVNAAGIMQRLPSLEVSPEDWNRVIQINLTGTFHCCQEAARVMKGGEEGGAIINIASLAGTLGWTELPAYGASKAAIVELTQTLASEWARYRIRVNAIAPGVFPTPLNRHLITGTARGKWYLAHTPMERFGDPEELVGAAIFLASPAASFITGETLAVDGGYLACGVPTNPTL